MLLSFVMVNMCKCKYIFLEKTQNGILFFCFSGLEYNLLFFTHFFERSGYGFVGIWNVFYIVITKHKRPPETGSLLRERFLVFAIMPLRRKLAHHAKLCRDQAFRPLHLPLLW